MFINEASRFLTPFTLVLLAACSAKSPSEPGPTTGPESEGAFELRVTHATVPVLQGATAEVTVRVVRKGDFHGAVSISALDLPDGATLAPATVEAEADEITVSVRAGADAPHSLPTQVELVGTADKLESSVELTVTVCGHPGALDTSFQGGRSIVPVGAGDDYANALAVTSEGKVIVAGSAAERLGDIALIRLERDGRLDATFGEGGKVTTSLGSSSSDVARAVAIQSDGKIVVAGSTTSAQTGLDFAVVRYLPDGDLDPSFGDGGKAMVSLSKDSDSAYALLIQKDGKVVAAGSANRGSSTSGVDFALLRLNADGSLDESFGEGGSVLTPIASNAATDIVYALSSHQVGGEERLLAAGGDGDFKLARYTPDGELDASFGTGGIVIGVLGSAVGGARSVRTLTDGKVLVAGHHSHDFALARFDASGKLDASFGDAGTVITSLSDNWEEAQGLAVDPDGKIVLGGWTYQGAGSSGNFALVRYSAEGALDTAFGDAGIVVTEVATAMKNDLANAVLLQSDDRVPTVRLLLAGAANGSNHDFAVTRYWR